MNTIFQYRINTKNKNINALIIALFIITNLFSQSSNQNQVIIRNDRVITLNGEPFFPIGVCLENQEHFNELINNGFNFINLFTENHFIYSDSCGFNSKDVISGDVTTSQQYAQLLEAYASDLRWDSNAHRIFNYIQNNKVYIFGDDFSFYPDDINRYIINTQRCGDSIIFKQTFNQSVRNASIARLVNISNWSGNKLIGIYAKDDANMFQTDGPYPTYYYDNYFQTRVQNFKDTYTVLKQGYPNSLVLMSIPPTYFPRAVDFEHWQNIDSAREMWIRDAFQLSQGTNVLFCPGNLTYESDLDAFMIYNNKYPSVYPYHLENTIFGRVLPNNKSAFGGLLFDVYNDIPDSSDPNALNKIKWHIYVGLEKGCTGLIFFGWHKYAEADGGKSIAVWKNIKTIINEMVNKLQLNQKVFINTNSGQIGHTITGSYSNNVSYAVYNINNWNDYYLLVTNNPNGSLFSSDPDNTITISSNPSMINWSRYVINEVFSNQNIQLTASSTIQYTMTAFGTALFHLQSARIPNKFSLYQNFPNPFNPKTKINYDIPVKVNVKLNVYDALGREVKTLVNENQNAGTYQVEFDGTNCASGVYFFKLIADSFVDTKKMILLK